MIDWREFLAQEETLWIEGRGSRPPAGPGILPLVIFEKVNGLDME